MASKIVRKKDGAVSLKKYTKFEPILLPTIQNLVSLGYSDADIGIIIGYSGKDARNWLKGLKCRNKDVAAICEFGKYQANLQLVSRAFQLATEGYDYVEVVDEFPVVVDNDGKETMIGKLRRKVKRKHIAPDRNLLWNLLCSRLSEYFGKVQKAKEIPFSGNTDGEIVAMFGKLGVSKPKRIESETIEVK